MLLFKKAFLQVASAGLPAAQVGQAVAGFQGRTTCHDNTAGTQSVGTASGSQVANGSNRPGCSGAGRSGRQQFAQQGMTEFGYQVSSSQSWEPLSPLPG